MIEDRHIPEVRRLMSEHKGDRAIAYAINQGAGTQVVTRDRVRKLIREIELADAKQGALVVAPEGGTAGGLTKYEAACRALAEAVSVDEVMHIRDQAEMLRAAGRIAKNRDLEMQAIEIRMRGERRLGELIVAQKETVGLAKGGQPYQANSTCTQSEQVERPATLAEAGIDRKLSSRAQKMAAVPAGEFEGLIGEWKAESAAADGRLTTNLLKVGAEQRQRAARRDLATALSDKAQELTGFRKYPAIYFDPPWRRKQGLTDRSYENHYPTMTWAEIIAWARSMRDKLLADAWGFMWIPRAHLLALVEIEIEVTISATGEVAPALVNMPLAWAVALAMGFDAYSTAFVWTKTDEGHPDDIGAGILVRDQDELLLLFKKGRGNAKPASKEIFGSNHRERSKPLGHSRKPHRYRDVIAKMVGAGVPVLECFARHDEQHPLPAGWDAWGNEALRLTDDAAQERGEVATRADQNLLPDEKKVSVGDIGLTHKDIHEARIIRDASCPDYPDLPDLPDYLRRAAP